MIDIKLTIYSSINHWMTQLRRGANNNSVAFKEILRLVVLQDCIIWAHYLGKSQKEIDCLERATFNYIRLHPNLIIEFNLCASNIYTNVNIPLTDFTWRMIDSDKRLPDYSVISTDDRVNCSDWDRTLLEANIPAKLVTYSSKNGEGPFTEDEIEGLTNQLRMDIYLDLTTGKYWWSKKGCSFELMSSLTDEDISKIVALIQAELPTGIITANAGDSIKVGLKNEIEPYGYDSIGVLTQDDTDIIKEML